MKFLNLLLPKYDPRITSNRLLLCNLCFQSHGSLGEQFLLFCLKILECTPTRHRKCKYNQKRAFLIRRAFLWQCFIVVQIFCFNHNVVFVVIFYLCSLLFIALIAHNILTLKLLSSFKDVTEFAHHSRSRQKHSTTSLVSALTSFVL